MLIVQRGSLTYIALVGLCIIATTYFLLFHEPRGATNIRRPSAGWTDGAQDELILPGGGPDTKIPDTHIPGDNPQGVKPPESTQTQTSPPVTTPSGHPISKLIDDARTRFAELMGKRSTTLDQAANRYRERRGRHPPPGFDVWFDEATKRDALVVEEFFDRIYHDLTPFWALDPQKLRRMANTQPQLIRVRNGNATFETDSTSRPPWIQLWHALVMEMMPHLPDLDMVVNVMDETRLLVPWDTINSYVKVEQEKRHFVSVNDALSDYTDYKKIDAKPSPWAANWSSYDANRYWDWMRPACAPDTPSRNVPRLPAFNESIDDVYPKEPMPYTYQGYVQNFTASQDPCLQPHLRGMHGTFVESVSMKTATELFPMFGGFKLPTNNEIVVPGAMYLTDDEFYEGGDYLGGPWWNKTDGLVWRGVASGGRNKDDNWWHFHRHRWVQMMNGTTVNRVQNGEAAAGPSFNLVDDNYYGLQTQKRKVLGDWLSSFTNVGFNNLECYPSEHDEEGKQILTCPYTSPFMEVVSRVPMKEQYDYKYLPDVDGNSYSARWRGFLRSTSCPLKATIFAEWHDDRLVPWVHFVPFDSSYMDIYGIMDFFMNQGHDFEASRIAEESSAWAAKVMRREDMMLYVWRLLLEYARVMDPKRERLAFVDDLRKFMD